MHAVVLVSGGGAVTPFSTAERAAASGLAAGNTMTALREHFVRAGRAVFTAPARIGAGSVDADPGWQGFADVPEVLPAEMTVNAVGGIDRAGQSLRHFLEWLGSEHGVDRFDLVVHSMGGLFSRAAIGQSARDGNRLPVRRLVTLGTPWTGALLGDYHVGDLPITAANGDASTELAMREGDAFASEASEGAAEQVTRRFLDGANGWNAAQIGALDGIPVTLIGGSYFDAFVEPSSVWPHDGLVQLDSALARSVPESVLPERNAHALRDVHSIFVADRLGIAWEHALTWDPAVFDLVDEALR